MPLPIARRPRTAKSIQGNVAKFLADSLILLVRQDGSAPLAFKEAIKRKRIKDGQAVTLPHYWATTYQEGRGPVRAKPGGFLVFWKDPKNDPRLNFGRPPVLRRDRPRLTRQQWYQAVRDAKAGRAVITKEVGPWKGNPVIKRAARRLSTEPFWTRASEDAAFDQMAGYLDRRLRFDSATPALPQRKDLPKAVARIR